jgi:hypothetical protein
MALKSKFDAENIQGVKILTFSWAVEPSSAALNDERIERSVLRPTLGTAPEFELDDDAISNSTK